jgi:Ran GTPase-activating protein (RanGAP) involved in mRNA processing and transport
VEALISPAGSHVRYLYLGENGLTAQHADALALLIEHGSLKGLYLNANELGDSGVQLLMPALGHNQRLEILALASNNLTAASAAAINEGGLGAVKVLELGVAQSAKAVGAQPNLLRDEGASRMAEFFKSNIHLIECGMAGNQISDVGATHILNALESNRTLERLVLGNTVTKRLRVEIYERLRTNNPTNRSAASMLNPYSRHVQSVYR